ncbi:MAG: hypothetical protein ABIV26_04625 [Candidatus Limnocylindrales bacterium]
MKHLLRLGFVVVILASACGGGHSPTPVPSPSPTPGPAQTLAQLKLDLIDAYGQLWYCDPDFYPLPRGEEIDHAKERWSEVTADAEAFAAIAVKQALDPGGAFTDEQKLAVYHEWKILNAIALDPVGNDRYRFDYLAEPAAAGGKGTRTGGTIGTDGRIAVDQQVVADEPICPICLARGMRIEAPGGAIAVQDVRIGDTVWTLDERGRRVLGTVLAIGSTDAPANHEVVRLVLIDGRSVTASPGHPLGDGRRMGDLAAGDSLAGSFVASADRLPYTADRTFDLVVSGPTGLYLIDGIALASTIR